MDFSSEAVLERLTLQATDPHSGHHYHLLYNPPVTEDIKDRLRVNPRRAEEAVRASLAEYHAHYDELVDYFGSYGAERVNADQDSHTVFETLEAHIVNPLPTCASYHVASKTHISCTTE